MILRFFDSFSTQGLFKPKAWALTLVAFSSPLYAEEPQTAETKAAEATPAKEASPFSGVANINLRSSTTSSSDYDYRIFISPGLNLEYELKDLFTVGFSLRGNKDLNNEMRSTLTDASLSLSRSIELAEGLGLGLDVSYGAPVSKDLIKYSNSKGTLGASSSLSYRFAGALKGLSVNAGISYDRYLYEYEFANGGQILTKYAWNQNYGFSYTYSQLTFSTSFTNVTAFDFAGDQDNDSYLWVETLAYKIDDVWSVSAGHINNGNTYDYLGAAGNVRFYDKRRSQVFAGTSFRF